MAYATSSDLRSFLSIDSATDNALLETLIGRAQAWIERQTRRVFEASADSACAFDALADTAEDESGRRALLLLGAHDLCAITSVTNGDGVVVAPTDYVTEPRDAPPFWALRLKAGAAVGWTYTTSPENAISIVGKWAYSTTPPPDIVMATVDLTAYLYRRRGVEGASLDRVVVSPSGVTMAPPGFPQSVVSVVSLYQRRGF